MSLSIKQEWVTQTGALVTALDWLDPCASFSGFADQPFALWFDSADTAHPAGRYSYIAVAPFETISIKQGQLDGMPVEPFDHLKMRLAHYQEDWDDLPDNIKNQLTPFKGGVGGYFGYDLAQGLEQLPPPIAPYAIDDAGLPDLMAGLYDVVLAFDHHAQNCFLLSSGFPETKAALRAHRARQRRDWLCEKLAGIPAAPAHEPLSFPTLETPPQSPLSAEDYQSRVQKIIDYIYAGDIFQANLAHRFTAKLNAQDSAFAFYKRLRHVSAAPFAGFFQLGDWALASASPERFLSCDKEMVEARPIKGTRPRQKDPQADKALAEELRTDQKERAENIMIVDLLRNDISKVCTEGSIEVPSLCAVESFPNVHHLVSIIQGRLKPDAGATDLLKACFPGGSITGAPKIRAMEIIAELENNCRGPYCGALSFIGFDGVMDSNITIRTPIISGQNISFQVGGGITAQSQPEAEYRETLHKAEGILRALGLSQSENQNLSHKKSRA